MLGALAAVVVAGGALRLHDVERVGIRFDDEGAYVADARLWHRCALVLTDGRALRAAARGDKAALQGRMDALGVDFITRYTKPSQGYTLLGALAMFAVGDRPAALLVVNAVSGTLAVIMIYAIGATLFGRGVGVCAALFLAVSPYHVFYCRSALAEATAGLFVLIGLWLWIVGVQRSWPLRRTYGLAGIALGYAVTCHYRYVFVPGVVMLAEVLMSLRGGTAGVARWAWLRRSVRGWLWLACGVAAPAVMIELVFLVARLVAWLSDSFLPLETYFQATWTWLSMVLSTSAIDTARHPVSPIENTATYVGYFVHWHGAAGAVLTLLGVGVAVRARGIGRVPALVVLVTVSLVVLQPDTVARALAVAVPSLCVCAAVGAAWIVRSCGLGHRGKAVVAGAVALVFVAPSLTRAHELTRHRSSIADACAFAAARGPAVIAEPLATYHRSKYWLYLEGSGVDIVSGRFDRWGTPETVVSRLRSAGVRWVICDPQRWHYRDTPPGARNRLFRWCEGMEGYLERNASLAAEFPHLLDDCWT
ncbi:MAG: ArnT family glycosyltransferase, partial [Phycisphaerae bacterium]